jgi:hypothetical protein
MQNLMRRWSVLALAGFLLLPVAVVAQTSATLSGTVEDTSGGALPGVTVQVVENNTGRQQSAVTGATGGFRASALPPGTYRVEAALSGFATMILPEIELLVGQNADITIQMALAGVEETITVTAEAPLVDLVSSEVAGNVDRRMMDDLPVQGRNWMELALLVKGITANDTNNNRPGIARDESFQLNLDGQQITQQVASSGFGQPKFSREAIAEFQIVTSQFDVTQGRSSGGQVNAITRSGTNDFTASFYGYFRDDRFNAEDHVAEEVLPFENQQIGGVFGGPIVTDKVHYFLSYEYEGQPGSVFVQPARLPNQEWVFETPETQNSFTARVDHTASDNDQLSYRVSYWDFETAYSLSSSAHPSNARARTQDSTNVLATWSHLWSTEVFTELKLGYNGFEWSNKLADTSVGGCDQTFGQPQQDQASCQPNYVFPGITFGGPRNYPQLFTQDVFSARFQLNWDKTEHDVKVGGEFLSWKDGGEWHLLERGEFIFNERPADLERRFPIECATNPGCWDVSGLDHTVARFSQNVGNWIIDIPRPTWAAWVADTWRVNDNLVLNFGLRYDLDWGALAPPGNDIMTPFAGASAGRSAGDSLYKWDIRDTNNIAPRAGFAYDVGGTGDLVIRGGSGIYHTISSSNVTFSQQSFNGQRILVNSFPNDGMPGFLQDPTRGVTPQQILNGEVPVPPQAPRTIAHNFALPYTWQTSIGFQKQLGTLWGFETDLLHWTETNTPRATDPNQIYDPVTGYNIRGYLDPKFTRIRYIESTGKQEYMAVSSGLRRRFRDNFQVNVTHTFIFFKNDDTRGWFDFPNNTFDPDAEWASSLDFQVNTFRLNGIYQLPYDFAVSGAYFYGSGHRFDTTIGGRPYGKSASRNRLNLGDPIQVNPDVLDRFDGPSTIGTGPGNEAPRNALLGEALHKVDVRLSKVFNFGSVRVSAIAEVFNLLNHENFGSYNGTIDSSGFGAARQVTSTAYGPRAAQFAFRLEY